MRIFAGAMLVVLSAAAAGFAEPFEETPGDNGGFSQSVFDEVKIAIDMTLALREDAGSANRIPARNPGEVGVKHRGYFHRSISDIVLGRTREADLPELFGDVIPLDQGDDQCPDLGELVFEGKSCRLKTYSGVEKYETAERTEGNLSYREHKDQYEIYVWIEKDSGSVFRVKATKTVQDHFRCTLVRIGNGVGNPPTPNIHRCR